MTITILVSAAEKYERPVNLLAVTLPSPVASLCSLSDEQMYELLTQLQPELEREDLADFQQLTLLFLKNGLPMVKQIWSHESCGAPDETYLPLGPYLKLWKNGTFDVSLKTIEL